MFGMGTGGTSLPSAPTVKTEYRREDANENASLMKLRKSARPISIRKLNMSPCLHFGPIDLVVYKGSYQKGGYLILRTASRLDAFSVYPIRT